jgi:hypothetical protein
MLLFIILLYFSNSLQAQPLPALIPFRNGDLWGYCDSNKNIKIEPAFASAQAFYNDRAIITLKEGKFTVYCLIDTKGNYIIPPEYKWTGMMQTGRKHARLNVINPAAQWGLVDTSGKLVIPMRYSFNQEDYNNGNDQQRFHSLPGFPHWFLITRQFEQQGMIDTNGNTLIPFQYDFIREPDNSDYLKGWIVRREGKWGLLHPDGREWIPCHYESLQADYSRGWMTVRKQGKMGMIDTNERILIPFAYDSVALPNSWDAEAHGCAIMLHNQWGWYDVPSGKSVKPVYATPPYGTGKYVIAARSNDAGTKALLLDLNGKLLIPPVYDRIIVYPDSIVVNDYHPSAPGREDWDSYSSLADPRTFKPVEWRRGCSDCKEVMESPMPQSSLYTSEPAMEYKGDYIRFFDKNGMHWNVCGTIIDSASTQQQHRTTYAYVVRTVKNRDTSYAVVDKEQNFIVQPQQNYVIINGNRQLQQLFVRRKDGQYLVTDLQFKGRSDAIAHAIKQAFRYKDKDYFIGYWQPGAPPANRDYVATHNCFRCDCNTLLDAKGHIVPGFEAYCKVRFLTLRNEATNTPQSDLLLVTDSLGREGIVNLAGKIQFPAISFKGRNMYFMGPDLVFLRDLQSGLAQVTNTAGNPLLGNLRIDYVSEASVQPYYDRYSNYVTITRLYTIHYYRQGSETPQVVYTDESGTLYGMNLE